MINLVFDLNNIVHRSMFIVSDYKNSYTFDSQDEIDQLVRKITTDISFLIRIINPSRIILCQDDSSWRKNIIIEENEGYKGNRTKNKTINWDNVYGAIDDFVKIMKSNGMIFTKISTAEADDIISLWANELSINQNQHVVIISGDEDIRQLVKEHKFNNNKSCFVTVFNPFMQGKNASRKLYVSQNFENWLNNSDDIDFMRPYIDIDKEDFKKISTYERTKLEVVDGENIILRKIFCGDGGDNIPALYSWKNDKGVDIRITNSKFEKIINYVNSNIGNDNEKISVKNLYSNANKILDAIKVITKQNVTIDIEKLLERQLKLVVLDSQYFPQSITNTFQKIKIDELNKPRVNYSKVNVHNLLEGTRYISDKKANNESPIFKHIDRINNTDLFNL